MADFTDSEKKRLLDAAASQSQLHTYLMGMNGQDGFCKLVENRIIDLDNLEDKHGKLESKVQGVIGILIGASVAIGGSFGISQLVG